MWSAACTSGIKLIGTGDVMHDRTLDQLNDSMLGIITTFQNRIAAIKSP
jgi:hypothetical protein